jgi:exosortase
MPRDRSAETARTTGPRVTGERGPWGRASVAVLVVVLYLPLFSALTDLSASNPYAGHVVFVPIFAAVLVWFERRRLGGFTAGQRATGLSITAAAVVLGYIAYRIADMPLYVVSFVAAITGLLVSFFGSRGVRAAVFPLGLLLLMIPPPREAMTAVALEVQHFVASFAAFTLSGLGVPVAQDGISLRLPGLTLIVAEECSGLRFLLILSVFAVVLARTVLAAPSSQVTLILLAVPIAVLANATRVTMTGAGAYAIGAHIATGPVHYYIGKACWFAALVATIALAISLRSRRMVGAPTHDSHVGTCVGSMP